MGQERDWAIRKQPRLPIKSLLLIPIEKQQGLKNVLSHNQNPSRRRHHTIKQLETSGMIRIRMPGLMLNRTQPSQNSNNLEPRKADSTPASGAGQELQRDQSFNQRQRGLNLLNNQGAQNPARTTHQDQRERARGNGPRPQNTPSRPQDNRSNVSGEGVDNRRFPAPSAPREAMFLQPIE